MAKGRFIKSAERACARKARFETAFSAESFCEFRYRAYLCPICHHFHLTSRPGQPASPPPEPPKEPGPKLGDLNWDAALNPQEKEKKPLPQPNPPKPKPRLARCVGTVRKDHKVMLIIDGQMVKSAKVSASLQKNIGPNTWVEVSHDSAPEIFGPYKGG